MILCALSLCVTQARQSPCFVRKLSALIETLSSVERTMIFVDDDVKCWQGELRKYCNAGNCGFSINLFDNNNNFVNFQYFLTKCCTVIVNLFSISCCKFCLNGLRFNYSIMKHVRLHFFLGHTEVGLYTRINTQKFTNKMSDKMIDMLL